jgi:large subunit ribosomal protein L31
MKKDIHPKEYRPVIFVDNTSGAQFLISSTIATKESGKWEDGKEYPLFRVEISSASHPYYTGESTSMDYTGRVEKFNKRASKVVAKKTDKKSK